LAVAIVEILVKREWFVGAACALDLPVARLDGAIVMDGSKLH